MDIGSVSNEPKSFSSLHAKLDLQNLYVVVIGPWYRENKNLARCEEAMNIARDIDWECKVTTFFGRKILDVGKSI